MNMNNSALSKKQIILFTIESDYIVTVVITLSTIVIHSVI